MIEFMKSIITILTSHSMFILRAYKVKLKDADKDFILMKQKLI
jgi:hypothetical protein